MIFSMGGVGVTVIVGVASAVNREAVDGRSNNCALNRFQKRRFTTFYSVLFYLYTLTFFMLIFYCGIRVTQKAKFEFCIDYK